MPSHTAATKPPKRTTEEARAVQADYEARLARMRVVAA